MNFLKSAICLLLFLGVSGEAQKSSLPQIRQNGEVKQFFVDGKPFIMLAGELHNSSASSIQYMEPIWDRLSALHLNTVIGTASWELVEPEEGKFDFSLVDAQIKEARKRNMRLVLIWFATWKNAGSSYVPYWVKADRKRFPPMVLKIRPDGRLATYLAKSMEQQGTGPLTPFGKETLKADARAFRALMKHIKEVDPQHTVVMMQVENEMGSVGDSRDRSSLAEAAWAEPVPAELMNYLAKHKSTLLPEMQKLWEKNGFKQEGSWEEVFGKDEWADEVFMAYYMGRYVNAIVTEGKAELNVPMYVNAWLGPQPKAELPGQWPSGGPVTGVMDIYRAAAPSIDLFAPDICGDIDLTGYRKSQSYYRDILWNGGDRIYATVRVPAPEGKRIVAAMWASYPTLPTWNWPGEEGKDLQVEVYSGAERVQLFLNGKLIGEKPTGKEQEFKAVFSVPYAPGTLKAIGLRGDRQVAENVLTTAGQPTALRVKADRTILQADGQDLSFITVEAVDAKGLPDLHADQEVQFEITGPGTIAAVGNGDGRDPASYQTNGRKLFDGRALVVIRSSRQAGPIKVTARSAGLGDGSLTIDANKPQRTAQLR